MLQYIIRRLLLMIPTFIGATFLVFVILQVAPDGPFERAVRQLKEGGGGIEGVGGSGSVVSSQELTAELLDELRMQFGLDKPIIIRYLIWLGIYPKEVKNKKIKLNQSFRDSFTSIKIGLFKKILLQKYIKVVETDDELQVIESGAGLEFIVPPDSILMKTHNIDRTTSKNLSFYRKTYEELPSNPSLIKTWYYSNWKIEKYDKENEIITLTQRKFQGIITGFLGYSEKRGKNVSRLIRERLHISIIFGISGFLLAYLVCIPLGIIKALKHGSKFDILSSTIVFIGYSIPGYALGILLLYYFGGDYFPVHGWRSANWFELSFMQKVWDQVHHAFLPVLCYMVGSFATLTVLMKNSLLENLSQDYVRTAFAKGLTEKRVIIFHAVRNSLIPLATGIGQLIGIFLAGSYLIELVFDIDGIGMLGLKALFDRDYNIIMGTLVLFTIVRLLGNLISDLTYALIDPRIRFK